MCGICCIFSLAPSTQCSLTDLKNVTSSSFLASRGPDVSHSTTRCLWGNVPALFAGFVLHLRGTLTPQPLINERGDILLWNGEIFDGLEIGETENDSQVLFDKLVNCSSEKDVTLVFQSIQGPWSVIFWQAKEEQVWFGRDVFGRRSLLWHLPGKEDRTFALSSVAIRPLGFDEVPSVGLFCLKKSPSLDPEADEAACSLQLHLFPWQGAVWPGTSDKVAEATPQTITQQLNLHFCPYIDIVLRSDEDVPSWMPTLNKQLPEPGTEREIPEDWTEGTSPVYILQELEKKGELATVLKQLVDVLERAVRKRVYNLPRHKEWIAHRDQLRAKASNSLPLWVDNKGDRDKNEVNPSKPTVPSTLGDSVMMDRTGGGTEINPFSPSMPSTHSSGGHTGFELVNGLSGLNLSHCRSAPLTSSKDTPTALYASCAAGGGEDSGQSYPSGSESPESDGHAHVAILFSGGVDSSVLAALADRCLHPKESIDLISVAFEQKAPQQGKGKKVGAFNPAHMFNVPDRQTGYLALSELNPKRQWNFIEVNVTQEMLQQYRSERVRHLLYPLTTVLDDSIGCAVWFAAGGEGVLGNGPNKGRPYNSKARVILCGMGADEQLAGYSRHRVRFKQESWEGLNAEVEMEINRISARNLGRDDRIITDHGKESRFPYLDEQVVAFLAALPIDQKADLRLPRGAGEKLLLRLAARQLGLLATAALPKRAIQFGSRIAKMEQSKEKGSHVCQRLLADQS